MVGPLTCDNIEVIDFSFVVQFLTIIYLLEQTSNSVVIAVTASPS